MKFINKSKYNTLIFKAINKKESEKIQKLFFEYGFSWSSYIYDTFLDTSHDNRDNSYFYLNLSTYKILFSNELDYLHITEHNLIYHKIYEMIDYNVVFNFLKNGNCAPEYKSKKKIKN